MFLDIFEFVFSLALLCLMICLFIAALCFYRISCGENTEKEKKESEENKK